jgi:hypothetical protein
VASWEGPLSCGIGGGPSCGSGGGCPAGRQWGTESHHLTASDKERDRYQVQPATASRLGGWVKRESERDDGKGRVVD